MSDTAVGDDQVSSPGSGPSASSPVIYPGEQTSNPGTITSSVDPNQSTSSPSPGVNSTDPPLWPPLPPRSLPSFVLGEDGLTYYTNTTIDDFSPLITFSNVASDWVSPLTETRNSSNKPIIDRDWQLGTYQRTETVNATVKIEFFGSEIYLYGDTGPAYGVYALTLDNQTASIHTAFYPALAVGRAHLMHILRNLAEGKHELTITALGARQGLIEGPAFLLDFAIARQTIGVQSRPRPRIFDLKEETLSSLAVNGTWSLNTVQDDIPPGAGGAKPEIYTERKAFWTTDNLATLTHNFRGTGVQVFGGRNGTHGSYRATLATSNTSTVVHSGIYNATAPCDAQGEGRLQCEWRGSTLKFAAADLDPELEYQLTLQNLPQSSLQSVFEIDLIRTIGYESVDNQTGTPDTSLPGSDGQTGGATSRVVAADLLLLVFALFTVCKALSRV